MPKTTKEIVHSLCRSDSLRSFLQECPGKTGQHFNILP